MSAANHVVTGAATRQDVGMLVRSPRGRLTLSGFLVLAFAMTAPVAPGAAAPKVRCKPGQVPVIAGTASKPKLTLKKGKAQCKTQPKLKSSLVEPAAATSQGAVASTADSLTQALAANPAALKKVESKLGKRATSQLVARTMQDWRQGASAQARRLADDGGFHFAGSFGDAAKGTAGSAKIDAGAPSPGAAGIKASATIEFTADSKGLKTLGADKITSGKSANVKLEIAFEDAPATCPTAAGRVDGKLNASAKLTLTIDGQTTTVSAKVEGKYFLTVGGDARWKTIDGVDVMTTFSYSAPGESTSTWRGERAGAGFTEKGIFGEGSGDFESAIKEQRSHIRDDLGGVWGPKGRVLYSDPSTDNIFNYGGSIAHLKGMVLTEIATQYLTFAAVEYIRQVVAPRGQKHWLDAEGCLKIDGAPEKAKLGPGESTKVTTKNARAFDGTPAATTQTATGQASFTPGSSSVAAGGSFDYTLTATTTSPAKANWQVVALSPAGKKTISGSLEEQAAYTVKLDSTEQGDFATHYATAKLTGELKTKLIPFSSTGESSASGPVTWTPLSFDSKMKPYNWLQTPSGVGTWTAVVRTTGPDELTVQLYFSEDTVLWFTHVNDEPPDPPPCSGQCDPPPVYTQIQGAMPVALGMVGTFTLPSAGGVKTLSNSVLDGGEGLTSNATVTVTPGG